MCNQQDIFRQTEGKLYWFYEAERKLELLKAKANRTHDNRLKLMFLRNEYREACAYQGAKTQYVAERVQGKKSIYSNPIEPAMEAAHELDLEILLLWERMLNLENRIDKYEQDILAIKHAISYLAKTDQQICQYKYKHKMSFDDIAKAVSMSKSGVRHRRRKIVAFVYNYLNEMI